MAEKKNIRDMTDEIGTRSKSMEAEEVVIKTKNGEIVIKNPEITVSRILGKDVYQIVGDVEVQKQKMEKPNEHPKKAEDEEEKKNNIDDELATIMSGLKNTISEAEKGRRTEMEKLFET